MPPPSKYFSLKYSTHSENITENVRTVPILLTISPRRLQNLKDYSIKGSMHKQKPKVVAGVVVVIGLQALRRASHTCRVSSSIITGFQSESAFPYTLFPPMISYLKKTSWVRTTGHSKGQGSQRKSQPFSSLWEKAPPFRSFLSNTALQQ